MTYRYEKWPLPVDGVDCIGTIRTVPENYYVADVCTNKTLVFQGLEACTKNLDQASVNEWWANHQLAEADAAYTTADTKVRETYAATLHVVNEAADEAYAQAIRERYAASKAYHQLLRGGN